MGFQDDDNRAGVQPLNTLGLSVLTEHNQRNLTEWHKALVCLMGDLITHTQKGRKGGFWGTLTLNTRQTVHVNMTVTISYTHGQGLEQTPNPKYKTLCCAKPLAPIVQLVEVRCAIALQSNQTYDYFQLDK